MRCAIYTRKSTEEGLEQEFNSLDAQRESAEAYILSQREAGWIALPERYDDGGYTGANLDRPALRRLLADIEAGRIDCVLVYKVDRLSRSLLDFARLTGEFDKRGVSFVSVTQQFNTTTSMGRLTLNILLSFAQFEREVIGERVRDKIAASKKKGMWMGGLTPLGYATKDRKLVAVPEEAETVRLIFRRYRELGSVRLLKQDLDQQGIRSKQRIYGNGSRAGGQPFSRGALYALLSNPVYIGEIAHKGARYPGQHEAILDRQTWDSVQDQLRDGAPEQRGRATGPRSPLIGKVFDEAGHRLTPSHATKAGRRYRYYVSRPLVTETAKQHPGAWRIPATQLEHLIATEAAAMLAEPGAIAAVLENAGLEPEKVPAALAIADRFRDDLGRDAARGEALAVVVNRIELSPIRLRVILSAAALMPANPDAADAQEAVLVRDVPLRIKRRGVEMRLIIEGLSAVPRNADPVLLKEIRRAHRCFEALVLGQVRSVAELATVEGISDRYVSSLLPLAFLAPDIIEAIAAGRQPPDLTAHRVIRTVDLPIAWAAQKQLLGVR